MAHRNRLVQAVLMARGYRNTNRNSLTPILPEELHRLRAAVQHLPCAQRAIEVHVTSHGAVTYGRLPALCALLEMFGRDEAHSKDTSECHEPTILEVAYEP